MNEARSDNRSSARDGRCIQEAYRAQAMGLEPEKEDKTQTVNKVSMRRMLQGIYTHMEEAEVLRDTL